MEETGLSAPWLSNQTTYYEVVVSSGTLEVELSGGTGNADLYVYEGGRNGREVCSSTNRNNNESCTVPNARGTYTIGVSSGSWFGFSGVTLRATEN
ncbi:PPC domain-containing protein [Marinibactrum halimedae]|nr:PPC domain-containing protein [Marinibactrum halimedae]